MMTLEACATQLNSMAYRDEIPDALQKAMEDAGMVVVMGYSDDLMVMHGIVTEEFPATPHVILSDRSIREEAEGEYDLRQVVGRITPVFGERPEADWVFETDISSEEFDVLEGDQVFCRGLVFDLGALTKRAGLFLAEAWDRDTGSALFLNGKAILEVDYDEHGSAGSQLVEQAGAALAEVLGMELVREEMSDEAYRSFMGHS